MLVTGASGYVGGAVASHLECRGIQVVRLSRQHAAVRSAESHVAFDLGIPGVSAQILEKVLRCDCVVHAAACLDKDLAAHGVSITNCLGTQEIVRVASAWRGCHLVYISSVPVIGRPRQLPITEEHPVEPLTAYHASKIYGEHLVRIAGDGGPSSATLRLSAPVGPGMPEGRFLSRLIRHAMIGSPVCVFGKGTRQQDYVDVRDVAAAVEKCIHLNAQGVFNVASGRSISNLDLARMCVEVLQSDSTIVFSGESDPEEGVIWDVSIARARAVLGYEPRFSLQDSIRDTAHRYANSAGQ